MTGTLDTRSASGGELIGDALNAVVRLLTGGSVGMHGVGESHLDEPHGTHDDTGRRSRLLDVAAVPQAEGDLAVERRPVDDDVDLLVRVLGHHHRLHLDPGDGIECEIAGVRFLGDGDRPGAGEELALLQHREQFVEQVDELLLLGTVCREGGVGRVNRTGQNERIAHLFSSQNVQSSQRTLE
jgi:hypothetical protein